MRQPDPSGCNDSSLNLILDQTAGEQTNPPRQLANLVTHYPAKPDLRDLLRRAGLYLELHHDTLCHGEIGGDHDCCLCRALVDEIREALKS